MILFGLILVTLFLIGLRNRNMSLFNKDIVTVLKPFLAFAIILHHLCVYQDVSYLHEFERWGPLVVGMFFFISGYGLSFNRLHNWGGVFERLYHKKYIEKVVLAYSLCIYPQHVPKLS